MASLLYKYIMTAPDGRLLQFSLTLDAKTLDIVGSKPSLLPSWTKLTHKQCPHCTLHAKKSARCPLAVRLVDLISASEKFKSFDSVDVQVISAERTVSCRTTAQRAISAILSLIIGGSGCPHTLFFKPMARFHLPFATEEENLWRATSNYLLLQYFLGKSGRKADMDLKGLGTLYENMHLVNISMAQRLRSAVEEDSSLNAIILMDSLAVIMPQTIDDSLAEIRYLFRQLL